MYVRDKFIRGRKLTKFSKKIMTLTNMLIRNNKEDIASILLGDIGKIYLSFHNYAAAEPYIKRALDVDYKIGDNFHVLARLTDLELIYKSCHDRKSSFAVLREKKKCLKDLINNYDENLKHYRSIHRPPTKLTDLKIQLAFNYTSIADLLQYNNPQDCIGAIRKARDIYKELGKMNEVRYFDEKIRRINAQLRNCWIKYHRYPRYNY